MQISRSKPWRLAAVTAVAAAAAVALGVGGSSSLAASPAANLPTGPVKIQLLWWGETEAPGSKKWLQSAQAAYHKLHPNVTFQNSLQSTDGYLPALTAAETAKKGPSMTYLWGGSYTMDAVWKGAVTPISDLVGMSEAKHYLNNDEATWDGKIWSAAWYSQPSYPIIYNIKALKSIGLTAYPATFPALLAACKASAAKGVPFIGLGIKDKWGVGRAAQNMLGQTITGVDQILASSSGSSTFDQPAYRQFFAAWQNMSTSKCFPDDVKSLDMYSGQQRVVTGKAVSTYITGSEVASYVKSMGATNAGVALPPKLGSGPYSGKIGSTSQTLAVTSWASDDQKAIGGDFIRFMHTPKMLQSYYDMTGVPPADDRFKVSTIKIPQVKSVASWVKTKGSPETENYFPYDVSWNGYNEAQAEIVTGKLKTVDQMVAMSDKAADTWRKSNRLLLGQYKKWAEQKAKSGG
jgi:raffinose/stachyose/melibiose transport system substrate-binding protein